MPASGNSKSNSKNSADWQKFDFVEIRLDDKEKADFKKRYAADGQAILAPLDGLLHEGYKLSISYDDNNKCLIASLTCKYSLSPNFNYVMTSRASDMWEAMALAAYKHFSCCDNGDWGAETRINSNTWG